MEKIITMSKRAKRANRPNPRVDRNQNNVIDFQSHAINQKKVDILPRNLSQERFIELLEDNKKDIVIATGPSGTGKSYISMLYAIREFRNGTYKRIILTRPSVPVDGEKHGYVPGTIEDKIGIWLINLMDILEKLYTKTEITQLITKQLIYVQPLSILRGRNIENSIIIADEMQNASVSQLKMLMTRLAEGSKLVINGDLKQMDRKFHTNDNGLMDFIDRLKTEGSEFIDHMEFGREDIVRHRVVEEVLRLYHDND